MCAKYSDSPPLGALLKSLRTRYGYRQEELAEQLHCDRAKISNWELGNHRPQRPTDLADLLDVLGVTPEERAEVMEVYFLAHLPDDSAARGSGAQTAPAPAGARSTAQPHPGSLPVVDLLGRGWVFTQLADFLAAHPAGYFRIVAEAGLGKTALAAALVPRFQGVGVGFSAASGVTQVAACQASLVAALSHRADLPAMAAPTEPAAWWQQILPALAAQRAGTEPIVLVIDAIDEAEPPPAGQNWLGLPDHLPAGVYIVLTHRPGHYQVRTRADTPVGELELHADDPRHQADIAAFIQQALANPAHAHLLAAADPPHDVTELAARLQAAAVGNFAYLVYALPEFLRLGPAAGAAALPPGLRSYYDQLWAGLTQPIQAASATEWLAFYQPLIALLAAAREPVTPQWLSDILGRSVEKIEERALQVWRPWLHRQGTGRAATWWVIHPSFTRYLADKLDLVAADTRISDHFYARGLVPRAADHADERRLQFLTAYEGYALRHLISHLGRQKRWYEVARVLTRHVWQRAHLNLDPTGASYTASLRAVLADPALRGTAGDLPYHSAWTWLYSRLVNQQPAQPPAETIFAALRAVIWPGMLSPGSPEGVWVAPAGWHEPAGDLAALLTGEPPSELANLTPAAAEAQVLALAAAYTAPGERAWLLTEIAGNLLPAGLSDLARRLLDRAWAAACAMPAGRERLLALVRIFDTESWIDLWPTARLAGRIHQALDLAHGEPDVALLINACAPQLDRLAVSRTTWAQLDLISRVALR